jgi:hypothetical protein
VWFVRDDLAWNEDDKRLWSYKRIREGGRKGGRGGREGKVKRARA